VSCGHNVILCKRFLKLQRLVVFQMNFIPSLPFWNLNTFFEFQRYYIYGLFSLMAPKQWPCIFPVFTTYFCIFVSISPCLIPQHSQYSKRFQLTSYLCGAAIFRGEDQTWYLNRIADLVCHIFHFSPSPDANVFNE